MPEMKLAKSNEGQFGRHVIAQHGIRAARREASFQIPSKRLESRLKVAVVSTSRMIWAWPSPAWHAFCHLRFAVAIPKAPLLPKAPKSSNANHQRSRARFAPHKDSRRSMSHSVRVSPLASIYEIR